VISLEVERALSNKPSRMMTGILQIFLEPEIPELKEIDVFELSEVEPPPMVIARP
jgi:hypothetical protein